MSDNVKLKGPFCEHKCFNKIDHCTSTLYLGTSLIYYYTHSSCQTFFRYILPDHTLFLYFPEVTF